jgi:hypothetical protein
LDNDDLIVEAEAARLIGIMLQTMRDRRKRGNVPPFVRCNCGHSYLYKRSDVEQLRKGEQYQASAS